MNSVEEMIVVTTKEQILKAAHIGNWESYIDLANIGVNYVDCVIRTLKMLGFYVNYETYSDMIEVCFRYSEKLLSIK